MSDWITQIVNDMSYWGVALLMALENIFPPIPSELVMPLAGYSAQQGDMSMTGVVIAGTIGTVVGAIPWYLLGRWWSENHLLHWVERHGRWLGTNRREVERALRWFQRWGSWAVGLGRLIPGIRTLISVPAGMAKMSVAKFLLVTTLGTAAWNLGLAWLGWKLGKNYDQVQPYIGWVAIGVVAALFAWWLWRVVSRTPSKSESQAQG